MNIFLDKCHPRGRETCRNGGTCEVNKEGTVSCHCSANHTGVYCDTGKISTPVKYLCLALRIFCMQWYRIESFLSFILTDKCFPGGIPACKNGGNCSITMNGEVSCNCPRYFKGNRCEQGIQN